MFELVPNAPPDPIFALMHRFNQDNRAEKINLTVGVFQNELGETPILDCVKQAEKRIVKEEQTKSYLGIAGLDSYNLATRALVLGKDHAAIKDGRALTIQTPGGTGALRLAADFVVDQQADKTIWCTEPTWANHLAIFDAAGAKVQKVAYLNESKTALDFQTYLEQVSNIPQGSAILFHTCCHNPTGFDPDEQQWPDLLELVYKNKLLPIFDFFYQGFFKSTEEDSLPIRIAIEKGCTVFVCNSYSKNMGLYSERVGGLTIVTETAEICQAIFSQMKSHARAIYSNPPQHGASIVATVLDDSELRGQWLGELDAMRIRLATMRSIFVKGLKQAMPDVDFSYIGKQNGMFSYSGLTAEQADRLLEEEAIYLLRSGRINIAGINDQNVERLCRAIAGVMEHSVSK